MKISIYVYKFPPEPDVGGRRWGLFAAQLASEGHDIIITTTNAPEKDEFWTSVHPNLSIRFRNLPTTWFPNNTSRTLISRMRWHLEKQVLLFRHRGRIFDKTLSLSKILERYVDFDCTNNTDVIIVSCAPFRWSLHIGNILSRFATRPKYFIDFRDPWSRNRLSYVNNLSDKRLAQERRVEEQAVDRADGIIVTQKAMLQHYPNKRTIFIPNNIDVPEGVWKLRPVENTIKLIFPGTLYAGGETQLFTFLQLAKAANSNHEIQLTLLGNWKSSLVKQIASICRLEYLGIVPREKVAPLIRQHHYVLSYVSKKLPYAINTKALEAIENKTPVIFLGENTFQDFIAENKIGWAFSSTISKEELAEKFTSMIHFGPFVQMEFSRQHAVQMLIDFIESDERP